MALSASMVWRWTREMPFPSAATDVASTPSLATGERFPAGDDGAGEKALREQPQRTPGRAHPPQEIPPRQPELEPVVEVLAGGEVRAAATLLRARQRGLGEELVGEPHVVARLRERRSGRLRLGMHAVGRKRGVDRLQA